MEKMLLRPTEVAEVLSSLKLLYPLSGRPERVAAIVSRLELVLRGMVETTGANSGRLITEDSFTLSRGLRIPVEWQSHTYSSSIALEGLTLP